MAWLELYWLSWAFCGVFLFYLCCHLEPWPECCIPREARGVSSILSLALLRVTTDLVLTFCLLACARVLSCIGFHIATTGLHGQQLVWSLGSLFLLWFIPAMLNWAFGICTVCWDIKITTTCIQLECKAGAKELSRKCWGVERSRELSEAKETEEAS